MKKRNPTYIPQLSVCIAALLGFICYGLYFRYGENGNKENMTEINQEFLNKTYGTLLVKHDTSTIILQRDEPLLHISVDEGTEIRSAMETIYSERKEAYENFVGSLNTVLDMILAMVVLGLFVLFYQPAEVEVPVVKFVLPDKLFYLVVPLGLIYLFFRLGLMMNAAIDSRMVLEIMTDHMETIGTQQVDYYHSNARTLVDQGLVDSWCNWYYTIFKEGRAGNLGRANAMGILFLWYGTFIGIMQAVCFCLISVYYEKYAHKTFTFILCFAASSGFIVWGGSLVLMYPHSVFLVIWLWGITAVAIFAWYVFGRKFAEQLVKKGKEHKAASEKK